jgi:hypothetical protein
MTDNRASHGGMRAGATGLEPALDTASRSGDQVRIWGPERSCVVHDSFCLYLESISCVKDATGLGGDECPRVPL